MLLTRTNSQLRRLTKDLRHAGLPFEVLGSAGSVWRGKLKQIQEFLNMLDSGGSTWKLSNVREVFEALPPHPDRKYWLYGSLGDVVTRSELMPALEDLGSAFEIARNLRVAKWKRDLLINTLKSPVSLKADELKVGTIHTSKGLEAPSVFLFTTSSKQTVTDCDRNPKRAAEEHRVYYVGATRASEELTLVSDYFEGPQAPPLVKLRRNRGLIA
jgi:superfamily I DNA/RNA helicase